MKVFRSFLALALFAAPAAAQMAKKPLTQADWDRWRSISSPQLSSDGKWASYTLTPQVGDGEYVLRSLGSSGAEIRIPVGYIGRPNNTPGGLGRGAGGGGGAAVGGRGQFSPDAKFAIVTVGATKAVVDSVARAQAAGRGRAGQGRAGQGRAGQGGGQGAAPATPAPANPATRAQFVIINLTDNTQTVIDGRAPRFAQESGKWMIYTPAGDTAVAGGGNAAAAAGGGRGGRGGGGGGAGAPLGARRSYGSNIVLRNMTTGAEEKMSDILSAVFDDSAKVLVYTVASRDTTKDGIFIRDMNSGAVKTVLNGKGNYRGFTFDRAQTKFAFTSDRDEFGKDKARSAIYVGDLKTGTATAVITPAQWPAGYRLPDNGGNIAFTRAGNAITFPLAPPPDDTVPSDSLVGKPDFDLWHYKDPVIQTVQKLRVNQERNRTYQALYNLTTKKIIKLADDTVTNVQLSEDARVGLSSTGVKYVIESMWNPGFSDVYLIDPATGTRKLLAEYSNGSASLSPTGKYVMLFDDGQWSSYNVATGKKTDVTSAIKGVRFDQETHSTPDEPNAWGIAGWTKDDGAVLIYDRFDIWQIDPLGQKPAVNVTDGVGRRENMTLRLIGLERDPEINYIDTTKPVWLRAFDEDTKYSGYYKDQVGVVKAPEQVIMGPYNYGQPQKAKNAQVYMYTRATPVEFGNLWVGPSLTQVQKISDANPQQKDYNWVTSELVTWTSNDGVQLQGILYKPENFDPSKKYPLISYFYEDLSDGLYNYVTPTGRNVINPTHYASNGYLVFEPDIYYKTGHPGMSAYNSIVPGVQSLIAKGFVDPKALGLQGQSWGGYQTAYIITQSNMFAAAMAGAPVANMTSAYGGIRWGSGANRAMQYENGQSRIGKNLWEAPSLYIENSPLFHLPNVTTPLFIMHNDQDDAVPWYQGIEMFIGMRRLGKEVYMINYNNDVHNPASRANQKDIAMRMQQFFDNKLKGAPEPEWMEKGIPAKDKGKDLVTPPPGIIRP